MFGTSSTPISSCLVDLYVLPSEIHLYVGPHRLIHFHVFVIRYLRGVLIFCRTSPHNIVIAMDYD